MLVKDVKTRPGGGESPSVLPALADFEVEVCGWIWMEAVVCFEEARRHGRGAELYEIWNTVEGDPVYVTHRSTPDLGVRVFVDRSADRFGAGPDFYSQSCADLVFSELQGSW